MHAESGGHRVHAVATTDRGEPVIEVDRQTARDAHLESPSDVEADVDVALAGGVSEAGELGGLGHGPSDQRRVERRLAAELEALVGNRVLMGDDHREVEPGADVRAQPLASEPARGVLEPEGRHLEEPQLRAHLAAHGEWSGRRPRHRVGTRRARRQVGDIRDGVGDTERRAGRIAQADQEVIRELASGCAPEGEIDEPRGKGPLPDTERVPGRAAGEADLRADQPDVGEQLVIDGAGIAAAAAGRRRSRRLLGRARSSESSGADREDGDDRETGERAKRIRVGLRDGVASLDAAEDSSVVESAFVAKPARPTTTEAPPRRLVIGITGSTGTVYGVRLLEQLRAQAAFEIHLVLSNPAKRTLAEETDLTVKDVEALADVVHDNRDIGASIASGSFRTEGMVIAPCSMKTASALATGHADNLIARAGDVTLKEGRALIVVVRETPLHLGHLRQLVALAEIGGIILPPMPAFYHRPRTVDDIVNHTVARILDRLRIGHELVPEWTGRSR